MADVAGKLGLHPTQTPWHANRDALWELAGLMGGISGSLGKIGKDLMLLGQSEVREVLAGNGGASSIMPQEANSVGAETLTALARYCGAQVSALHPALKHVQDRDSAA